MKFDPASFRDDRGRIFWIDGQIYRGVYPAGLTSLGSLTKSGLYQVLLDQQLIIPHQESPDREPFGKVIQPELLPFISYPYEWTFDQLKDAAMATLKIQQLALEQGQSLRDASAYNIQFVGGRPLLIDSLSFEPYHKGRPWVAYRQFCQHFLAPLVLASYIDQSLIQLLRLHLDGIPLPLTSKLLGGRGRINAGVGLHIRLQARAQSRFANRPERARDLSPTSLLGIIDSLERTIQKLKSPSHQTEWANYYGQTNYSKIAEQDKAATLARWGEQLKPKRLLDMGANDGRYSRMLSAQLAICCDIDPGAVSQNYARVKADHDTIVQPVWLDLANPSPGLGWANLERSKLPDRAKADVVMALALVHHLAIGNNLPLEMVAQYFAQLGPSLIIEFVPKGDSQAQRLLATREDIFPHYTETGFEQAFGQHFKTVSKHAIKDSGRRLYLMRRHD